MSYIIFDLKTNEYVDSTENKWDAFEYLEKVDENNEPVYGCREVDLGEVMSVYWERLMMEWKDNE